MCDLLISEGTGCISVMQGNACLAFWLCRTLLYCYTIMFLYANKTNKILQKKFQSIFNNKKKIVQDSNWPTKFEVTARKRINLLQTLQLLEKAQLPGYNTLNSYYYYYQLC